MRIKGRRLKRFLGFRHEKLNHFGCIEVVSPGFVKGWVASKFALFEKVKLFVGKDLIAVADLDEERSDVSDLYECQEKPGFSLVLPNELSPLDWSKDPKVFAYSSQLLAPVNLKSIE